MKDFGGTFIALIVLAIIGGAWLFLESEDDSDKSALVCAINPTKLATLTIKNEHGPYSLKRNKRGEWVVERAKSAEREWPTDRVARDNLFHSIARLMAERWLNEKPSGEDLGFAPPQILLEWTYTDNPGKKERVVFGKVNKAASTIYATKENDKRIFSVSRARIAPLLASPMSLRDRRVATIPFDRVKKLELQNKSSNITFTKVGEGLFSLVDVEEMRAFPPKVRWLTDEVTSLRADGFSDLAGREDSYFGFDKPNVTISVEFLPPLSPLKLIIGKRHPESSQVVFMKNAAREVAYHIRADQLSALLASKDEFRDRTPFTLPGEPFDFIQVYDHRDKKQVIRAALTKVYSRWDLHSRKRNQKNLGHHLLPDLEKLRARSYRRIPTENLANMGLHEPLFRVILRAGNDPDSIFKVGKAPSGTIYVLMPDQAVASVDDKLIEFLNGFCEKFGEPWSKRVR